MALNDNNAMMMAASQAAARGGRRQSLSAVGRPYAAGGPMDPHSIGNAAMIAGMQPPLQISNGFGTPGGLQITNGMTPEPPQPQEEVPGFANGGEVRSKQKSSSAAALGFGAGSRAADLLARETGSGPVRGPGTGTSDSVKTAVPEGTYIMPADSTEEVGEQNLASMGFQPGMKPAQKKDAGPGAGLGFGPTAKVPVNLSNGEFRLSPEQVHAIGVQVLEGLKAATHEPAGEAAEKYEQEGPEGEDQSRPDLYFADGGVVPSSAPVNIVQGLREAIVEPIISDVRQGNRVIQREFPLAYQAAQLHPAVGIPTAGLNYADAMEKGDTQGAIAASLSSIPIAEKAYRVGNAIASGAREIVGNRGFRSAANNLGRRFGAGEQTAESFEAGQQQGQLMAKPSSPSFADGGLVEDPNKRPLATSPTNTYPGNQAERAGNIYAKSNADAASLAKSAFPGTTAAIQGAGQAIQDAYRQGGVGAAVGQGFRGSMVPAVGLVDDAATGVRKLLDPAANALKTFVTGDSTPIGQEPAAAPKPAAAPAAAAQATTGAPTPTSSSYGNEPNAAGSANAATAPAGGAAATTSANGITREGNSFSGTGTPAAAGQGFGFRPGGSDVMGILQRESQIRAGMGDLQDQINFNNGGFGWRKTTNDEIVRDMLTSGNTRDRASALGFMAGGRDANLKAAQVEQEQALRQAEMEGRQGIANEELGLKREAQGFQTRAQAQQEALQARYEAAKTPEERSAIAQQIRDLSGKDYPNRFTVVPGGQEVDPVSGQLVTRPSRVINNQTGQFVDQTQASGDPRQQEGAKLRGKDGKMYQVKNGVPVPV